MFDGADTVVLYEELAFQDVLPVLWRPMVSPVDRSSWAASMSATCACCRPGAIEEHGPIENRTRGRPLCCRIMRLDFKINLLLDLVGQLLVANRPAPRVRAVRFNAQGAVWRSRPAAAGR